MDRTTFERRPKPSALWFGAVARANALVTGVGADWSPAGARDGRAPIGSDVVAELDLLKYAWSPMTP